MAKIALIKEAAALNKAIATLNKRGEVWQAMAHRVALSCLYRVEDNGDIRPLNVMFAGLPAASRSNGFVKWACAFGKVEFLEAEDGPGAFIYARDKETNLAGAEAKPFWTFKAVEGGPAVPLDALKLLQDMVAKLQKDEKKHGTDHAAIKRALQLQIRTLLVARGDTASHEAPAPKMLPAPLKALPAPTAH